MRERDVVLGILAKRITEADELARKRWAEDRWCEEARAKYLARYLRDLRTEIGKALKGY